MKNFPESAAYASVSGPAPCLLQLNTELAIATWRAARSPMRRPRGRRALAHACVAWRGAAHATQPTRLSAGHAARLPPSLFAQALEAVQGQEHFDTSRQPHEFKGFFLEEA